MATSTSSLLAAQCSGVSAQRSRGLWAFGSAPAPMSIRTICGPFGKYPGQSLISTRLHPFRPLVHPIAKGGAEMAFARFMATGAGRILRIVAGLVLIGFGLYLQSTVGIVVAVIGLVPLLAGVLNVCLIAPILGVPFSGRELTV